MISLDITGTDPAINALCELYITLRVTVGEAEG